MIQVARKPSDSGCTQTICKWRKRYSERGIEGLYDAPRPGQPRKLDGKTVKKILDDTAHKVPKEATHWSISLMAEHAGVTRWQVHQIWKAADLKPHRLRTFKISNDPHFAEKVCDVVGLYMNPPRIMHWFCLLTKRPKFRLLIGPSRNCSFARDKLSDRHMITSVMAQPACTLHSIP